MCVKYYDPILTFSSTAALFISEYSAERREPYSDIQQPLHFKRGSSGHRCVSLFNNVCTMQSGFFHNVGRPYCGLDLLSFHFTTMCISDQRTLYDCLPETKK